VKLVAVSLRGVPEMNISFSKLSEKLIETFGARE